MENSGVKSDLNCVNLAQEASEENIINMRPRNCSHDVLVKNIVVFFTCVKSLHEAKLENFGLTFLF